MKPSLVAFRSKLVYPCRKALSLLVFKGKLLTKRRRPPKLLGINPPLLSYCRAGSRRIGSVLRSAFSRVSKKKNNLVDREMTDQLESMNPAASDAGRDRLLQQLISLPLLNTPPSSKTMAKASPLGVARDDLHEDACRSFENYLVEMIVEEGKVRDLMDVEELLYCWKTLKCPVFVDLVSRFYGELCKDLFSATASEHGEASDSDTP